MMWLVKTVLLLIAISALSACESALLHLLPVHSIQNALMPSFVVASILSIFSGLKRSTGLAFFSFAETCFSQYALCGLRATIRETNVKGHPHFVIIDGAVSEMIKCLPLLREISQDDNSHIWTVGLFSSLAFATGEIQAHGISPWKVLSIEMLNIVSSTLAFEVLTDKCGSKSIGLVGLILSKIAFLWLRPNYTSWYVIIALTFIVMCCMLTKYISRQDSSTIHKRGLSI